MAKKKILQYGNPILEQKSEKVSDIQTPEIKELIEDMLDTLSDHEDHGAGLSAPQIGILKRVVICRRLDLEEKKEKAKTKKENKEEIPWEIMINPEVISKSATLTEYWEGCLSINNGDLFGAVARPSQVKVKYSTPDG